jgi:hypothetical protein
VDNLPNPHTRREIRRILDAVRGGQDASAALDGLSWPGVKAVLDYVFPPVMDKTAKEIQHLLGKGETDALRAALAARVLDETEAWREAHRRRFIRLTDPYWAITLHVQARLANREGEPWTGKGRSRMEAASERALARRLSRRPGEVTPHIVGEWLKRHETLAREGFEGDWLARYLAIYDVKGFNRRRRK